jgi:hypothetical protein
MENFTWGALALWESLKQKISIFLYKLSLLWWLQTERVLVSGDTEVEFHFHSAYCFPDWNVFLWRECFMWKGIIRGKTMRERIKEICQIINTERLINLSSN